MSSLEFSIFCFLLIIYFGFLLYELLRAPLIDDSKDNEFNKIKNNIDKEELQNNND